MRPGCLTTSDTANAKISVNGFQYYQLYSLMDFFSAKYYAAYMKLEMLLLLFNFLSLVTLRID